MWIQMELSTKNTGFPRMYKMYGVESAGKKGVAAVSGIIGANKRWIELFLVGVIALEYIPHNVLGFKLKRMLSPINETFRVLFRNQFFHLALFVTMIWALLGGNRHFFILLAIFMMTYRIHHEIDENPR